MLQYEAAKKLYEEIKAKKAECEDEDTEEFYRDFLTMAADYAKTRLAWAFMDLAAKREDDAGRTIKHNAFMARLTAVCRYLEIKDIETIMPDRKTMGDFACYLAMFLALEQR